MFITALFTIAKCWKQPKCPSVTEWIKNCGTFTQWNTAQQKERRRVFVTAWMELESIMLSEISQAVKHKYHVNKSTKLTNEQNITTDMEIKNKLTILFRGKRGRGIMEERRGRGKQRNTNRGLMCTDNVGDRLWEWGGRSRGEQWGKRWDNCN